MVFKKFLGSRDFRLTLIVAVMALLLVLTKGGQDLANSQGPGELSVSSLEVFQSLPVTPGIFEGDLRDLPQAEAWKAGDPVHEVPKRVTRYAEDAIAVPPAQPKLDPLLQLQESAADATDRNFDPPELNFDGISFTGAVPPDTVGDVGLNHYIQMVNSAGGSAFAIFDKAGTQIVGPINLDTLWSAPGDDFDLQNIPLRFQPDGAGGFDVTSSAPAFVAPAPVANLLLNDESFAVVALGFNFPFHGVNYGDVFVNDNGHVTFGAAPIPPDFIVSEAGFINGPPRIAPFWNDLNPDTGGGVFFEAFANPNRAVITWSNVPEFFNTGANTAQLTLFETGEITFRYNGVTLQSALVGIGPGGGLGAVNELDFSEELPLSTRSQLSYVDSRDSCSCSNKHGRARRTSTSTNEYANGHFPKRM